MWSSYTAIELFALLQVCDLTSSETRHKNACTIHHGDTIRFTKEIVSPHCSAQASARMMLAAQLGHLFRTYASQDAAVTGVYIDEGEGQA